MLARLNLWFFQIADSHLKLARPRLDLFATQRSSMISIKKHTMGETDPCSS
jgi:hypothetical protein